MGKTDPIGDSDNGNSATVTGDDNDEIGSASVVNPASASSGNDALVKRGRGRPRKDGGTAGSVSGGAGTAATKEKKKTVPVDKGTVEKGLLISTAFMAAALNSKMLALTETEASFIAPSAAKVLSHFNIVADDTLTGALIAFAGAIGTVYGMKFLIRGNNNAMGNSTIHS